MSSDNTVFNERVFQPEVLITMARRVPCVHCGASSPSPCDGELAFCCQGCEGAYALIHGWGLDDYYALRDRLAPGAIHPVEPSVSTIELLENLSAAGVEVRDAGSGLCSVKLAVDGLHCGACSWLIERCPALLDGWQSARVQMSDHTLQLVYDPKRTNPAAVARVLHRLGYQIAPIRESEVTNERHRLQDRRHLTRIAIAFFCAANAMWIAIALYAGEFSGIAGEHANVLRWAGTILGFVATALPGNVFFRGAWAAMRTRTPHMDLPVALGLSAGVIGSLVGAWRGKGDIYFDSLAVLVFLLLFGRWIQFRQQRRAGQAVSLLMRLTPQIAHRIAADGKVQAIPAERLVAGDLIEVRAGETIAADGFVVTGNSLLDRALLTGESIPDPVNPGDEVAAGTINLFQPLTVRIDAVGPDSRVGRLMQMVEDGVNRQTPIVQLADRIGGWFVVIVLLLALGTVTYWWRFDAGAAIEHSIALLIVACPCALALATPLSIAVALGRAAKRRILIRSGDVFERMAKPGFIWFDKTGTLTTGRMEVRVWDGGDELLAKAAAVEQASNHPIATAVVRSVPITATQRYVATNVQQYRGGGIQGEVDGKLVRIGTEKFLNEFGIEIPQTLREQIGRIIRLQMTPVLVAESNIVQGVLGIADALRSDARDTIRLLRDAGWQVGILSGDHPDVVAQIAQEVGVPLEYANGGFSPEQKLQMIERSRLHGTVVMVGDGVNDAAALAAADVGIATQGGAEVSLRAAPVFLADGRLQGVFDLTRAARQTVSTVRRGFVLSLGYNLLAVSLAVLGKINPLVAAILMPISSLSVVSLALASQTFSKAAHQPSIESHAFASGDPS